MQREQLKTILVRCHQITGDRDFVVIGSQSIHGAFRDHLLPEPTTESREADVLSLNDPEGDKMWALSSRAGEGTGFDQAYGLVIDGVDRSTPKLPAGWAERLIPLEVQTDDGGPPIVGWCLEPHDLAVAKAIANREKDTKFIRAAAQAMLISPHTCLERLEQLGDAGQLSAEQLAGAREFLTSLPEPAQVFRPSDVRPPAGRQRPTLDMMPVPRDMYADLRLRPAENMLPISHSTHSDLSSPAIPAPIPVSPVTTGTCGAPTKRQRPCRIRLRPGSVCPVHRRH
jgi:hypothetical protein